MMTDSGDVRASRSVETAGEALARILFGWHGPMWRYRDPWGPWMPGQPPTHIPLVPSSTGEVGRG